MATSITLEIILQLLHYMPVIVSLAFLLIKIGSMKTGVLNKISSLENNQYDIKSEVKELKMEMKNNHAENAAKNNRLEIAQAQTDTKLDMVNSKVNMLVDGLLNQDTSIRKNKRIYE